MTTPSDPAEPPLPGGNPAASADPQRSGAIGVFAKHWTPGATKTRLAATIGPEEAATVSRCFVETILARLATVAAEEHRLAFSPREQEAAFNALPAVAEGPWHSETQAEGSLGERMAAFFRNRAGASVLVGSDSPDMPLDEVRATLDWLNEPHDRGRLVLGPTSDGGYWLIGIHGEPPPIFADMPWSEPSLLDATIERLASAGWIEGADYRLAKPWYDVDEAADLARLRQGLRRGDAPLLRLADRLDDLLGPP